MLLLFDLRAWVPDNQDRDAVQPWSGPGVDSRTPGAIVRMPSFYPIFFAGNSHE